ncbi:MAG TPA: LytTR family transcriptional regulator DNA-binding domain-containing protein [Pyrinomonadaceae bacterium]|nr:LytTR family transcriptional regulator DNA-binding domain-containing protein [Pyrinomonadaceae bacterium]
MANNPIKVLVIDDESLARDLIIELLKDFDGFQVIGECSDGLEAVKNIEKLRPDLIFLDVQMPILNGLDVLEKIREDFLPQIIFVTAFDNYAIRAFDFHAIDYLLKPFSRQRFHQAVLHAKAQITQQNSVETKQQFSALIENHKNKPSHLQRIFVKDNGKIILLEPETVDWIEADDKYLHLHTAQKTYLIRQTLNSIEAELDPNIFLRIHRSTIVNLTRVKEIHPIFNGEYILILQNGAKITLSRNYKNRFFERFGKTS